MSQELVATLLHPHILVASVLHGCYMTHCTRVLVRRGNYGWPVELILAVLACNIGGIITDFMLAKVPSVLLEDRDLAIFIAVWFCFYYCPRDLCFKIFDKSWLWVVGSVLHYTLRGTGIFAMVLNVYKLFNGAFFGTVIMGTLAGAATSFTISISRYARGDAGVSVSTYLKSHTFYVPVFLSCFMYYVAWRVASGDSMPMQAIETGVVVLSVITGTIPELNQAINRDNKK